MQVPKNEAKRVLDRGVIVREALGLMNESGLDAVTTRRLAVRLNVEGPALYHHFRGKPDLLSEMANLLLSDAIRSVPAADWKEWIMGTAIAIRAALGRYRDGARLVTTALPNEKMDGEILPAMMRPLIEGGFTQRMAQTAILICSSIVVGWTLNEQNPEVRARLEERADVDAEFRFAVRTLIQGLACELAEGSRAVSVHSGS